MSILQLGAWLGALMNGPIAQKLSRKYSMMIAVAIFTLGSALQAGARNESFVWAGRFIAGLSIGMLSHVVPMYQSEISPPEIRGALVSLQQFSITIGILVSFWVRRMTLFRVKTRANQAFFSSTMDFISLVGDSLL